MKKLRILALGLSILVLILATIQINSSPLGYAPCSSYSCNANLYTNPCKILCTVGEEVKRLFPVGWNIGNDACCCGSWSNAYCQE